MAGPGSMIARFSAYGFLKNQRYHEPFFVLALLEQGLSFLDVGVVVGLGSILVNVFEVPFGAIADVYGRRRCLLVALLAYIAAFAVFGMGLGFAGACAAMTLFAVGEGFRGGTHKAMIFDWLRARGRQAEAADVYGTTRSWSKRGSAISAVVGAVLVLVLGEFTAAFWWTAVPYVVNLVNLATYPAELDARAEDASVRAVARTTWAAVRSAVTLAPLRKLLLESMVFEGSAKIAATYVQPIIQLAIVAAFVGSSGRDGFEATVVAAGVVYFALGLVEAEASKRAGGFARWAGDPAKAIARLWWLQLACAVGLLASLVLAAAWVAIVAFVVLFGVARNLFRAVQLARYDASSPPELAATVLSLESQAQALLIAIVAPIVGWAVDRGAASSDGVQGLWPAAVAAVVGGAIYAVAGAIAARRGVDG